MSGHSVESDAPYDPCHGDPQSGWHGGHGTWEPCPVCDPPSVTSSAVTEEGR